MNMTEFTFHIERVADWLYCQEPQPASYTNFYFQLVSIYFTYVLMLFLFCSCRVNEQGLFMLFNNR